MRVVFLFMQCIGLWIFCRRTNKYASWVSSFEVLTITEFMILEKDVVCVSFRMAWATKNEHKLTGINEIVCVYSHERHK